jgi:hypothetical protein
MKNTVEPTVKYLKQIVNARMVLTLISKLWIARVINRSKIECHLSCKECSGD